MDADGGERQAGGSGSGEQGEEGGEDGGLALDSELTPEEIMMMQQMGIPFVSGLYACALPRAVPVGRACLLALLLPEQRAVLLLLPRLLL